ncbi:MAG: glycosyltransferase family 1 protein [bacterium]|nr:glycosyltransferase family 1 protein [bacterium]
MNRPLHIAVDASRTLVPRQTGTEYYARALIQALIQQNTRHRLTLYFREAPPPDLFPASPLVSLRVIPFRRLWTHLRFAAALWQDRPDVTFVPAHTLPFLFPGKGMVTAHDLGYKVFPQAHTFASRLYLDLTTRYSTARARIVLADSQATADDLTRYYGTPPAKIRVVYPGVAKPAVGDIQAVRPKYHLPERYFFFIGTLQPRKNIARIVQAYQRWRQANPDDEAALVLAGGKGWLYDEAWVAGVEGVRLLGYIDEADKGALYAGALALVFPTLYEGFGFPVLEAMHCGTPVIASSTSSLPELVGDAGLLVDPLDVEAIAQAMTRLATDQSLRTAFTERGKRQASRFTWTAAAADVLKALEEAGSTQAHSKQL